MLTGLLPLLRIVFPNINKHASVRGDMQRPDGAHPVARGQTPGGREGEGIVNVEEEEEEGLLTVHNE